MPLLRSATAISRVIVGSRVTVETGEPEDPPHAVEKRIVLGAAMTWDPLDRYGVFLHECAHHCFPAKYFVGLGGEGKAKFPGYHQHLPNLIDDCRIERQFIAARPDTALILARTAINVIVQQRYAGADADPWDRSTFNPAFWVLIFFRSHLPRELRLAVSHLLLTAVGRRGLDSPAWRASFAALIEEGQLITRISSVSPFRLMHWVEQYLQVFPWVNTAERANADVESLVHDNPQCKGSVTKKRGGSGSLIGAGDAAADSALLGEVLSRLTLHACLHPKALADHWLQRLRMPEATVQAATTFDSSLNGVDSKGEDTLALNGDVGAASDDRHTTWRSHTPDPVLVHRLVASLRRLHDLSERADDRPRSAGHLHLPTIIRHGRTGLVPPKPFRRPAVAMIPEPVACVLAMDISGSTRANGPVYDAIAHAILVALRRAGCRSALVAWETVFYPLIGLRDPVSQVSWPYRERDDGTSLLAAAAGVVHAVRQERHGRRIACIVTDGEVDPDEVPVAERMLAVGGISAALLISLAQPVEPVGVLQTTTITATGELPDVLRLWIAAQVATVWVAA